MGICASNDSNAKGRGRNTNRRANTKRGGKKPNARQQKKKYDSESEDETSEGSRSDSDPEDTQNKPTTQQPLKIATPANEANTNYPPVAQEDMDILFYKAFTCTSWASTAVPHEILRNAMKLALLAPSAYNCCPMRVVFVASPEAKAKLLACVNDQVHAEVEVAPVTAVICTDKLYTRNLPKLMPYVPNAQQMFEQYEDLNEMIRIRNSNLQAGYLILALRSLGLAVGPISGLDNEKCDDAFLEGTSWKSNIIINLGYPKDVAHPAAPPPLPFDAAAKLIV